MRALLLASTLLAALVAAPAGVAQPCYPDACCGSTLDCALYPVKRLLDDAAFPVECHWLVQGPDNGFAACYTLDPRADCHAWTVRVTKETTEVTCLA